MANRGDEAVHQIAKRARDDEETAQQGPGPAQPPRDSQRGRRSQVHLAVLDQNQAARCLASHPIQGQERRSLVGLGRAKSKIPLRVTRRYELDGALAERAGPVEEHDGALINAAAAWACVEGSRSHKLDRRTQSALPLCSSPVPLNVHRSTRLLPLRAGRMDAGLASCYRILGRFLSCFRCTSCFCLFTCCCLPFSLSFLPTFVSHACFFSAIMTRDGE